MEKFSKYIGLDVHKETIAVGIADARGGPPRFYGEIRNEVGEVRRLIRRLGGPGERLKFCYEAGPCGYELHRQILAAGQSSTVVAPSLIPRKAGERIKTDRRDGLNLARRDRAGELTPVWVPDEEQEAMRDLSRAREDMKVVEKQLRQRLSAFLLRQGRCYRGQQRWTQAHFRWLEQQQFASPIQQIVLEEYVEAIRQAQTRTAGLVTEMRQTLETWTLREAAQALTALRGVDQVAAITLLAELGDITRFDHPRELMGYLGLTPCEHSSGPKRRRGEITKTGNGHARRILIECAWAYRFPARKTARIQRRAEKTSPAVQAIAWKAQKRLCGRFRRLTTQGKRSTVVVTAVARELAAFLWAIVRQVRFPGHLSAAA